MEDPAGTWMVILDVPGVTASGESSIRVDAEEVSVTFKFPAGAGAARVPVLGTSKLRPTVVGFRVMAGGGFTVIAAEADGAPVIVA